jgi:hypothetical protein
LSESLIDWRWAREQWNLLLPLLVIGPVLVALGWLVEDSGYLSDTLLQFGSTLTLLVPLFLLERRLDRRLTALSGEIDKLRISFSESIGPDLHGHANKILTEFQDLLVEVGLRLPENPPAVIVTHGDRDMLLNFDGRNMYVGEGILESTLAVRDAIPHVYAHHVLSMNRDYPHEDGPLMTIEAGLADFLTAIYLGDPAVGRRISELQHLDPVRDLSGTRAFSSWDGDPTLRDAHGEGESWGQVFWEVGTLLDLRTVGQHVTSAWCRCGSDRDFVQRLTTIAPAEVAGAVENALARRSWQPSRP